MDAIEFYSGIGGLATAAKNLNINVKLAFDIHPLANKTHQLNFPDVVTSPTTICKLSPKILNKLYLKVNKNENSPSFWLLSPPCQPFSRRGQQKDMDDQRNESFLHLIKLLPLLDSVMNKPRYILLENVAGFEKSDTHRYWIKTLHQTQYTFQEFLLSPTQFNIPNQRLRYFCIAKLKPLVFSDNSIFNKLNRIIPGYNHITNSSTLQEFLEEETDVLYSKYFVKPSVINKSGKIFDIVNKNSTSSNCFTKSYGRYVEGSGSVIETNPIEDTTTSKMSLTEELLERKLRYFSPNEMLNLHGFPPSFKFPDEITTQQAYKLIGNSLNVKVVQELLEYLLKEGN